VLVAFSALTLLVGRHQGHPTCKKTEWWGAGVVVCLEQGADLHMAQLMPLSLTVSCFTKIRIGFTFLVPAHLASPGKKAVKQACVRACVRACVVVYQLLKFPIFENPGTAAAAILENRKFAISQQRLDRSS